MMDNFRDMTGKSVYARNVKRLAMENIEIKGSDDTQTELINVIDFDSYNVVYVNDVATEF
jgi:hypothetical protein